MDIEKEEMKLRKVLLFHVAVVKFWRVVGRWLGVGKRWCRRDLKLCQD